MVAAPDLTAEEQEQLADLAERILCDRSFVRFLQYVKVRSDDPNNPSETPWEPWDALLERARSWEQMTSEVILKARQLGFTWLVAAYLAWRARKGAACAVFSKGQRESRELVERIQYIEDRLPIWLRCSYARLEESQYDKNADEISYPDVDGRVVAFPSTEDAGISFTFQVIAVDEAHFHPYAAANFAAYQPTISAGGQLLMFSTADPTLGPSGLFPEKYWASKRHETPYEAVFVPWDSRPGRDAAWRESQRSAYGVKLANEFNAYYPETDAEAFVGKSGLVYHMFDESKHVRASHPWDWNASKRKVAGVDFGGGDPTAVVMLGMSGTQYVHQFGEFYQRGAVSVYDLAAFISAWEGPGEVECDPSQGTSIETLAQALRGTGWNVKAADNRRGAGMEAVAFLLDNDRLTIHAGCTDSIAEFPGYRWREAVDPNSKERYATHTPVDHHADAHDARRYAAVELLAHLRPMTVMPTVALNTGRPLSSKAV